MAPISTITAPRAKARALSLMAELLESRRLPAPLISEFPIRTLGGSPTDVARGLDGNLWFTLDRNIGKLNVNTGAVTQYPIPTDNSGPGAIVAGPNDGNMWFLETANNAIAKINMATGAIQEYPLLSSVDAGLKSLIAGPDGNIWFTEAVTNRIGRLTPSNGVIREFDAPQGATPWGITSAGGALWYTMSGKNAIGKIGLDTLSTTTYPVSASTNLGLKGITAAADGTLWYTASVSNEIWTSTISAPASGRSYSAGLSANAGLDRIALATGGSGTYVYFTETSKSRIGVLAPNAATISEIQTNSNQSAPTGLAAAGDGNLYIAGATASKLAKLPVGSQTMSSIAYTTTTGTNPGAMVVGADGGVWYTLPSSKSLGRFDPATHITQEFPLTTITSNLAAPLVAGPNGDLFFAESGRYIGRFSTTSKSLVREYTTTATNPQVAGLAYNTADSYLWFTAPGANAVYRLDLSSGADTAVTTGISSGAGLGPITVSYNSASYGIVWVAETKTRKIDRIDPRDTQLHATAYAVGGTAPATILDLKYNQKDGKLWWTPGYSHSYIATLDPANPGAAPVKYNIPVHYEDGGTPSYSSYITFSADGLVWYTQGGNSGPNGYKYLDAMSTSGGQSYELTATHNPYNVAGFAAAPDGDVWYNSRGTPGWIGKVLLSAASAPTQLAITTQPPTANSTARGLGLVVSALNATGQVATDYTGPITISLLNNPANAVLGGILTVYAVNGRAIFRGLTLDRPVSGYFFQATTPDLPGAVARSNSFAVANSATHLVVTTLPASVIAGSAFVVRVAAVDSGGRTDPFYFGGVSLTLSGGVTLSGTRIVAADAGVATFSNLSIQQAGTGYTLAMAGDSSVAGGITGPFDVVPGAIQSFRMTTSIANPTAGVPFDVTVMAIDAYGNRITNYNGSATLTSDDPRAGTLGTYTFQPADQGLHTFPGVTLTTSGARSLTATSGGGITFSTAVPVSPATVAGLAITPASGNATAGVPLAVLVSAVDAYGNVVPSYAGTIRLGSGDPLASLPADYPFTAADQGRHSFAVTLRTLGTQGLSAAEPGGGFQASASITVSANSTRTILSSSAPSAVYGQSPVFQATVSTSVAGGDTPTGTVQFAVDGQAVGSPVPLSGGRAMAPSLAGLGAGAHAVTATYSGDSVASGSDAAAFTATIFKATLRVQAVDQTRAYGQANPENRVTYNGFVLGEGPSSLAGLLTYSGLPVATSPAGGYAITLGGLSSTNYDVRFLPATLTVAPAPLTITAPDVTRVYGQGLPADVSFRYDGFVNGETAANLRLLPVVVSDAGPNSPVGGAYHVAGSGASSPNYAISYVPGNLIVTPASLTVTAESSSTAYGSPIPRPSVRYDGLVSGDSPSSIGGSLAFLGTATQGSPVGDYTLTPGGLDSANYIITYAAGALRIAPAPLTIAADDATKAAGAAVPALTLRYIGLVHGDTPASLAERPVATTMATASSRPGAYAISLSGGASPNYAITLQPGTLTVTAPVVVRSATLIVKRGAWTGIVLTFSGSLDPASIKAAKFRLAAPGRDGRYGTRDDQVIKLRAASYKASSNALTILLAKQAKGIAKAQFRATGLADASKASVDGNRDQMPGGDVILSLAGRRIRITGA